MAIAIALQQAAARLQAVSDSPRLDAELLLCHLLGQSRTYLFTWPERALTPEQARALEALLVRREAGEPVAHILGRREFWSLELAVSADTLIPRPETELLVEAALAHIPQDALWHIADLGTGSGAIALAIASERPLCRITAVERSEAALAVARRSGRRLGLSNVEFVAGSWFEPLVGRRFEVILSNPPYIRQGDPHLQQGDVRFEPLTALVSGEDGLEDIRHLITHAPSHLARGGWLLLEHGYDQGEAVVALLRERGFAAVEDRADLQGHGRVAVGRFGAG
ncbi:MAG: peptide chain release factor N(5)-glutamine methyltransferase [Gammaproteobacteria bacterium]|nr:peptide chain release factor N(5)-glutamine methyltransferase [Gammaproteobacteria bacterium]MCW8839509.1 peptide chain release factor N(5)-glutamine methyltransferase [Gammaproteobacteria bacterium]MCW8958789.1 peptide chain release factor N(5)-glutamine methyltransferase [Gammaproteobacteria bacterium]MCW8972153.1 peptide chain release factor N(5)-glutamine methyltransferase [Gammaproteobacteria bacterium]MCW8992448.1 peptide chain release factor N(5)-glutamine methyltransferase [Gammaprot